MTDPKEQRRAEMRARLETLKQTSRLRRRGNDWIVRIGLVVLLLLPAGFGYYAYVFIADGVRAVSGAQAVKGKVREVERRITTTGKGSNTSVSDVFIIHVKFTGSDGRKLDRPVQYGGAGDDDTHFAGTLVDLQEYRAGTIVDLLYHPELGDRIWLDDFRPLWLLSLILIGCTLVSGNLVIGGMVVFWP